MVKTEILKHFAEEDFDRGIERLESLQSKLGVDWKSDIAELTQSCKNFKIALRLDLYTIDQVLEQLEGSLDKMIGSLDVQQRQSLNGLAPGPENKGQKNTFILRDRWTGRDQRTKFLFGNTNIVLDTHLPDHEFRSTNYNDPLTF